MLEKNAVFAVFFFPHIYASSDHSSILSHSFFLLPHCVSLLTYTPVSLHMACYLMTFLGVRDTVDIPTSLLSYQKITSSHHCITAVFQHTVLGGLKHFRNSNSNPVLYSLFLEVKKEWKIRWTSALILTRELHLPPLKCCARRKYAFEKGKHKQAWPLKQTQSSTISVKQRRSKVKRGVIRANSK